MLSPQVWIGGGQSRGFAYKLFNYRQFFKNRFEVKVVICGKKNYSLLNVPKKFSVEIENGGDTVVTN